MDAFMITVGDYDTSLNDWILKTDQKVSKVIENVNMYGYSTHQVSDILLNRHGTFIKIDCILDYKVSLDKFQRI